MDLVIADFFLNFSGSVFYSSALFVLAKYLPYLTIFLMLFVSWKIKNGDGQAILIASLFLSAILSRGIVVEIIRFFYDRPRPFLFFETSPLVESFSPSFPSGHASFFFALSFIFLLLPLFSKSYALLGRWGWIFFVLSVVNGTARIGAGIHWTTDIIGGVLVGFFSALIVLEIMRGIIKEIKPIPDRTI